MSQAVDLRHMEHARKGGKIYIAAEDWNFAWTPSELESITAVGKAYGVQDKTPVWGYSDSEATPNNGEGE